MTERGPRRLQKRSGGRPHGTVELRLARPSAERRAELPHELNCSNRLPIPVTPPPQAASADSTEILRHLQGLSCSWDSAASGSLQLTVGVDTRRLDILVGTMMLVDKRW